MKDQPDLLKVEARKRALEKLAALCAEIRAEILTLQTRGVFNPLEGCALQLKIQAVEVDFDLRAQLGW